MRCLTLISCLDKQKPISIRLTVRQLSIQPSNIQYSQCEIFKSRFTEISLHGRSQNRENVRSYVKQTKRRILRIYRVQGRETTTANALQWHGNVQFSCFIFIVVLSLFLSISPRRRYAAYIIELSSSSDLEQERHNFYFRLNSLHITSINRVDSVFYFDFHIRHTCEVRNFAVCHWILPVCRQTAQRFPC